MLILVRLFWLLPLSQILTLHTIGNYRPDSHATQHTTETLSPIFRNPIYTLGPGRAQTWMPYKTHHRQKHQSTEVPQKIPK